MASTAPARVLPALSLLLLAVGFAWDLTATERDSTAAFYTVAIVLVAWRRQPRAIWAVVASAVVLAVAAVVLRPPEVRTVLQEALARSNAVVVFVLVAFALQVIEGYRRRADADLANMRRLLDAASDGVWQAALDGTITHANAAARQLLVRLGGDVGSTVERLGLAPQALHEAATAGRSIASRVELDGTVHHLDTAPVLVGGTVLQACTRDVTALASEERRRLQLEQAVLASPSPLLVLDAERRVQLANAASAGLFGHAAEALVGMSVADLGLEVVSEADVPSLAEVSLDGPWNGEMRVRHGSGERRLRVSVAPIRGNDDRVIGAVAFAEDVTELRRLASALAERSHLLESAQQVAGVGHGVFDPDAELFLFSAAAAGILGQAPNLPQDSPLRTAGLVLGLSPRALFALTDDAHRKRMQAVLAAGGEHVETIPIRRPDGDLRWVRFHGEVVPGEDGGAARGIGVLHDVTEEHRRGEEQRRLDEQLRQTQKLESLGVMAGGVAHEFNNLLAGIVGNADLALLDSADDDRIMGYLDVVLELARRGGELTRQMLAYSGQSAFQQAAVPPAGLVEDLRVRLAAMPDVPVVLDADVPGNLPEVRADREQLVQLLLNLLTNAGEAQDEGSGAPIGLQARPCTLTEDDLAGAQFSAAQPGHAVAFSVVDHGRGMDAETRRHLFEPFFSTREAGRGLGMAAVLGIVRSQRGAIWVTSAPGEGTTVRVAIPVAAPEPAARSPVVAGRCALVVDDEGAVRTLAAAMLERMGFAVTVAEDGTAGIEAFRAHPERERIGLVLADMTMPGATGHEVYRALEADGYRGAFVFMSGYAEEDVRREGTTAEFLQKPFGLADLRGVVERLVPIDAGASP